MANYAHHNKPKNIYVRKRHIYIILVNFPSYQHCTRKIFYFRIHVDRFSCWVHWSHNIYQLTKINTWRNLHSALPLMQYIKDLFALLQDCPLILYMSALFSLNCRDRNSGLVFGMKRDILRTAWAQS